MPARRQIDWVRFFEGDVYGGSGRQITVPVRVRAVVHNATVSSVIIAPYCVQAGSIFVPGPDIGETLSDQGPGQVNC